MFTYVITATIDYGDSVIVKTKIVRSEKQITQKDHAFLSYLFNCDMSSGYNVDIDIALLEDSIDIAAPGRPVPFLFVERQNGVLYAHIEQVTPDELSLSHLNQLLITQQTITGSPVMPKLGTSHHDDSADFVFVVDLNKVKPDDRLITDLSDESRGLLQEKQLVSYVTTLRHYHMDSHKKSVQTTVLYFPDNACIGLLERDGAEHETLSLFGMDGKPFER